MRKIVLYTLSDVMPEVEISDDMSRYGEEKDVLLIDISMIDLRRKYQSNLLFRGMAIESHVEYQYRFSGSDCIMKLDEVVYFESNHRQVFVFFLDGHIERFYKKLDDLQMEVDKLCDFFVRCSKSLYINYMYSDIKGYNITTIEGKKVEVTRGYRESFKEKISKLR